MQKVISVNIDSFPNKDNDKSVPFSEHEYPELNKYLADGYKVVQFYQIAPGHSYHSSTLTFILEK